MENNPKIDNLTDIEVGQFFEFLDFIILNHHTDEVVQSLKDNGFDTIRCSVEPIRHVQSVLKETYKDKVTASSATVIMSSHNNNHCK